MRHKAQGVRASADHAGALARSHHIPAQTNGIRPRSAGIGHRQARATGGNVHGEGQIGGKIVFSGAVLPVLPRCGQYPFAALAAGGIGVQKVQGTARSGPEHKTGICQKFRRQRRLGKGLVHHCPGQSKGISGGRPPPSGKAFPIKGKDRKGQSAGIQNSRRREAAFSPAEGSQSLCGGFSGGAETGHARHNDIMPHAPVPPQVAGCGPE